MSQRVRFSTCVILLPAATTIACAGARESHVTTSPRAVGSDSVSNTKVVGAPSSSAMEVAREPSSPPMSCLPRVEVSTAPGEDSWLAESTQALCCRFEGYVSAPPLRWAGSRDCLTQLVPGLRPNAAFRAEMPLPYEMRLPLDGAASALSVEQRRALDQLLQSRKGRSGSAPTIKPSLPEDRFAEHVGRARQLAKLSLEYLRTGGLTQTQLAPEAEWRAARGSKPYLVIGGVENALRPSVSPCVPGVTLYADVPVSARSVTIEACRNGVCSRGSVELPSRAASPAEPGSHSTASGPGTPNALAFALRGGVPAGALLTLRGTVEDGAPAQQKLEHPTLVPRATADQRALEVRIVPTEPLRDSDRYSLALFLDGGATPSLKAEHAAHYRPSATNPDCKDGALSFSATTVQTAPQ